MGTSSNGRAGTGDSKPKVAERLDKLEADYAELKASHEELLALIKASVVAQLQQHLAQNPEVQKLIAQQAQGGVPISP